MITLSLNKTSSDRCKLHVQKNYKYFISVAKRSELELFGLTMWVADFSDKNGTKCKRILTCNEEAYLKDAIILEK